MKSAAADVIVIGAGIAGLAARQRLAAAGMDVLVLEARERLGGRIFTQQHNGYPVELGAEFVHGRPPEMLEIIQSAGLRPAEVSGEFRSKIAGQWEDSDNMMSEVNELFDKIPSSGPDQSFQDYLESTNYSVEAKQQASRFVEGFHAADPAKVGIHWLLKATKAEESIDGDTSFRMPEGYSRLVETLAGDVHKPGEVHKQRSRLLLNTRVTAIRWQKGDVLVMTSQGEYRAAAGGDHTAAGSVAGGKRAIHAVTRCKERCVTPAQHGTGHPRESLFPGKVLGRRSAHAGPQFPFH